MSDLAIAGRIVLVVEDEFFVADSLKLYLEQEGAVVVGPVASVDAALELIGRTERLDAGIVDVNLQGKRVFPVADALAARGVPFIFITGYERDSIPKRFASVPSCPKPFHLDELVRLLLS